MDESISDKVKIGMLIANQPLPRVKPSFIKEGHSSSLLITKRYYEHVVKYGWSPMSRKAKLLDTSNR
jgi:hypothetical protein